MVRTIHVSLSLVILLLGLVASDLLRAAPRGNALPIGVETYPPSGNVPLPETDNPGLAWYGFEDTLEGESAYDDSLLPGSDIFERPLGASAGNSITAPAASKIIRRLVYHEIPMTKPSGLVGGNRLFAVSFKANRIAFFAFGANDKNEIHVMNTSGGGLRRVDSYIPTCFCTSEVDISEDGSRILSWDGGQILRMVNADGTNAHPVIQIDGGYKYYRLSRDGKRVFFMVDRDWTLRPSGESRAAGLYVINANGTGLRQIVNADQVAALFGTTPAEVPFHWGGGNIGFGMSADSSRIVFQVFIQGITGQRMFRVNSNGTGLHAYAVFPKDYYWGVSNLGISGNGAKLHYVISPNPCCSTPEEVGVFNFNGTGKRVLFRGMNPDLDNEANIRLSDDGSVLNTGSTGRLYKTNGGGALALAVIGGWFSTDPESVIDAYLMTMNDDATRFVYLDSCGGCQLLKPVTLSVNSRSLGQAPKIGAVVADPAYLLTDGRSSTTLRARVSTPNTLVRVSGAFLRKGLLDYEISQPVLLDDGTQGDVKPGDGIFTSNQIRASSVATVGPRTVRVRAEVHTSSQVRHATVVDFEPFAVSRLPK